MAGAALTLVVLGAWMLIAGPKHPEPAKTVEAKLKAKPARDRTDWNDSRNHSRGALNSLAEQAAAADSALEARQWNLALERIDAASAYLKSTRVGIDALAGSAGGDDERQAAQELQSGAIALRQKLDRLRERAQAGKASAAADAEALRRKAAEDALRRQQAEAAAKAEATARAEAAARAEAVARAREQLDTEDNVAVEGADINILRNTAKATCIESCQTNSQCRSYAYDKWNEWCFLKSEARTLRFDPKYESGVKRGEKPVRSTEAIQFDPYRRRAFPVGAAETTQRAEDADQCETACDGNRACIAYTFLEKSQTCRLLRTTPTAYEPNDDATSGVKRQPTSPAASAQVVTLQPAAPPKPGTYTVWLHNDSEMRLFADGLNRRFVYEKPREGLVARGVRRGTLLFDGRKDGETYSGRSRIFSPKCGPLEYEVSGKVAADQRRVEMTGQRPIVDDKCRVTRTERDTLVFEFLETRSE
jgi:hypothetical protein